MADPWRLLSRVSENGRRMPSLLAEDVSTIFDSELTTDTSPQGYVHSHNVGDGSMRGEDHGLAQTPVLNLNLDFDTEDGNNLTFTGFRPMRNRLTGDAASYLMCERRWSNENDSATTVGQKNLIIIFVGLATIEECLVCENSQRLLPVAEPFDALMEKLGMLDDGSGIPRPYTFLQKIRLAFIRSRADKIRIHQRKGSRSLPEPSDLSGLGRMLLDVVDRHITFLHSKKPLTRLCVPMPLDKVLKLGLIRVKNQLRDKPFVDKCFTIFVPTIPAWQQTSWPRPGKGTGMWEPAEAMPITNQSSLAIDLKPRKHAESSQPTNLEFSKDEHGPSDTGLAPNIPGIPADRFESASPSDPKPPAEYPHALSGLQIFKTAVSQVHKAIKESGDGMALTLRDFIDQIEKDIEQFHATLQVGLALPAAQAAAATSIPGSNLNVLLERQFIRSLMLIGLGTIRQQWNEGYLTDNARQKIMGEILDALHMIKEAADEFCSAEA